MYLWRAVDSEGEVLDILVQSRRNKKAGIVTLTDWRLFSAFLHETKPLKLRKAAIDNLPGFRSESG